MSQYAILKKPFALRGWKGLEKAVVNTQTGEAGPVLDKVFYVLAACDGQTDFNSLLFLDNHRKILELLEKEGAVTVSDSPGQIDKWQRYRKVDNPFVFNVHWAVTGCCNLKCRHCYVEAPDARYSELPFSDLGKIVDSMVEANVPAVGITGGEPLLREDLFDLFAILADVHIPVRQIYTNGILVNEKLLQRLDDAGLKPEFHLSFDGVGFHDRMRGLKGVEKKTLSAIRLLCEADYAVSVSTVLDKASLSCALATYELMKELGIKVWRVMSPYETGAWKKQAQDEKVTLDEEFAAYRPVFHKWCNDGYPMVIQLANLFDGRRQSHADYKPPHHISFSPEGKACDTCAYSAYLEPGGRLLPCLAYTDTDAVAFMPNVLDTGFAKAWSDVELRKIIDLTRKDLFPQNPDCEGCEHFYQCGMGCRAVAYQQSGDLYARHEDLCAVYSKGYRERFLETV